MRLNKLFFGLLSLGLMASCSSNEEVKMPEVISHDGDYMAVGINLPTTPSTRASNDNFDDGTADEYKVANGCLVLFVGTTPADAQFAAAYDLSGLDANGKTEGTTTDNITTSYKKSVKLDNFSCAETDDIFAFVMLNYTNVAKVTESNGLEVNGTSLVKKGADEGTPSKFDEVFYKPTSEDFYDTRDGKKTNFFMCNAPLSSAMGGTSNPTETTGFEIVTLVELDKTKLFQTQAEAELAGNEAGVVNVERGVAKASINWTPTKFEGDGVKTEDGKTPSFAFIGWKLDVTESTSFISRKTMTSDPWWAYNNVNANNYRFVGSAAVEDNHYRTYWCVDPTYSRDIVDARGPIATYDNWANQETPLYCYENTFDVEHQNYRNTTRAIFQATLKFGDDDDAKAETFYILNGVESNIYLKLDDVESYPRKLILESDAVKDILDNSCKILNDTKVEYSTADAEKAVKITFERDSNTGIREVTKIDFDVAENDLIFNKPTLTNEQDKALANLITQINSEYVITEYAGGNTYYDFRFMHFASELDSEGNPASDDLAPWSAPGQIVNTTDQAYPNDDSKAANNWLGRYGMVRNNWYDVTILKVLKLGSPVIPDVSGSRGDTSDDNKENYLAFKINVLSWAKRTQYHQF